MLSKVSGSLTLITAHIMLAKFRLPGKQNVFAHGRLAFKPRRTHTVRIADLMRKIPE
ncbi:MAG: hypothetical protein Q7W55_10790 [Pseudohongiella sp.]|nr:hypothetical protein [Pseudohongiella sp.]MDP2128264.1 hypothetical protein [Pseudohongiella sp.]